MTVEGGKWFGREGYSNIGFPAQPATPSNDRTCTIILWCKKILLKKFESESDIFFLKTQNSYFQLPYRELTPFWAVKSQQLGPKAQLP